MVHAAVLWYVERLADCDRSRRLYAGLCKVETPSTLDPGKGQGYTYKDRDAPAKRFRGASESTHRSTAKSTQGTAIHLI